LTVVVLLQFTSWVDAVIFVFSLENDASFNAIYNYYAKMSQYRNMQEIPLILVGTQGQLAKLDYNSSSNLYLGTLQTPYRGRSRAWSRTVERESWRRT
jgi:hypothetical protein